MKRAAQPGSSLDSAKIAAFLRLYQMHRPYRLPR